MTGVRAVDALYRFLYSTAQGHMVSTAIHQPVLIYFHRSLLDRDDDLLMHRDNKTLSHKQVEGSFLLSKIRFQRKCILISICIFVSVFFFSAANA